MTERPLFELHANRIPFIILSIFFIGLYIPLILFLIVSGLFSSESISEDPVSFIAIVIGNIVIFVVYGFFMRGAFRTQPVLQIYSEHIVINALFSLNPKVIRKEKITRYHYLPNTVIAKGQLWFEADGKRHWVDVTNFRQDNMSVQNALNRHFGPSL